MKKRKAFLVLCLSGLIVIVLYLEMLPSVIVTSRRTEASLQKKGYLVHTDGCTIQELDPYDESIRKYVKHFSEIQCDPERPAVTVQDGLWLRINRSQFPNNATDFGHCAYSVILRQPNSDSRFNISKYILFHTDFKVSNEFLLVSCYDKAGVKKYTNYHAFILPKDVDKRNFSVPSESKRRPSVLFVGVDSVSRLNMLRQLNATRRFLTENLGGIEFYGYNKVADNTFVNVVPLLAGKFIAEIPFDETTMRGRYLDDIDFLWKAFSSAGYLTYLAEDSPNIGTFNYLKAGFRHPPTDYYFRPFSLAMRHERSLWHKNEFCFVNRLETRIVLDWLSDFLDTNQNKSFFAYTFLTRLSHDYVNGVGVTDNVYLRFFQSLHAKGQLENVILFFFSDHGMRFGSIRNTYVGKMEERLPMLFIHLPPWFKKSYPLATRNLRSNAHKLTTPFDIYYTLKDILSLSFGGEVRHSGSRRGHSLFTEIAANRTCEEAEIAPHWCTCQSQVEVDPRNNTVTAAAMFTLAYINQMTNNTPCATLELKTINRAWRSVVNSEVLKHSHNLEGQQQSLTDYQIMFTAVPGEGNFETTVRHFESTDTFQVAGDISRINMYGSQSHCVHNTKLKKYCYCL